MNREQVRQKLLRGHSRERRTVTLFGVTFDLLQPSLGEFMKEQAAAAEAAGLGVNSDNDGGTGLTLGPQEQSNQPQSDIQEWMSFTPIRLLLQYAVVEGTEERIFTEEDLPVIVEWPFSAEFGVVQTAIYELTGFNMDEAKQDMSDPTSEQ